MTAFIRIVLGPLQWILLGIVFASPAMASSASASSATASSATAATSQTILVLGDSISAAYGIEPAQGWVRLLQERLDALKPGYSVVNASVSGETTGGGLARLPSALERHAPDVVIIELGGNDGLRGYPITRIRGNLTRMTELALDSGARVLLAGMFVPPNYGERYMQGFNDSFHEVAGQFDVPLVPFFLEGIATRPELMQDDGIHPTARAQSMLLDNLWPLLEPLLATEQAARLDRDGAPAVGAPRGP
ncbi:MAG TPA: arylesterase [Pseudomonadales bacterium]|nr:arylesterase [Pseudomonadales bacterium]